MARAFQVPDGKDCTTARTLLVAVEKTCLWPSCACKVRSGGTHLPGARSSPCKRSGVYSVGSAVQPSRHGRADSQPLSLQFSTSCGRPLFPNAVCLFLHVTGCVSCRLSGTGAAAGRCLLSKVEQLEKIMAV